MTAPKLTAWATKTEAAAHARVSPRVIQDAVNAGDLKAYAIGKGNRDYRLDLADVDGWMKARSYEPRSA